ncbi:hypothetical protein H0H93_004414 [Arthromyces matolae]|nr:hypothetical protein H0H93_004414 [Arthromyces matolae]
MTGNNVYTHPKTAYLPSRKKNGSTPIQPLGVTAYSEQPSTQGKSVSEYPSKYHPYAASSSNEAGFYTASEETFTRKSFKPIMRRPPYIRKDQQNCKYSDWLPGRPPPLDEDESLILPGPGHSATLNPKPEYQGALKYEEAAATPDYLGEQYNIDTQSSAELWLLENPEEVCERKN